MLLTITDAAKAAGVARSTIYDRVRAGELSRGAHGKIDTAELLRVFGELQAAPTGEEEGDDDAAHSTSGAHAEWLQELADRQLDQIERLTATVDRQAEELREAEARAERREATWLRQLETLTTKLLPAPVEPPAEPEPPRGFWSRLVG